MTIEKPAKGVRGFLLYDYFTHRNFFRTYNEDKTFVDYDICAEDIEIEIIDESISLYVCEDRNRVDYTSEVLGHDKQI